MRRLTCLASLLLLGLGALAGCSWNPERIFTFSQPQGGNIAASDSIGSGLTHGAASPSAAVTRAQD